jgi:hypothetical protein
MTRRQLVLHERVADVEPGSRTIVASFSIRVLRGRKLVDEVARVEVHADGSVYSRKADGTLERSSFGELEQHRADALLWLSAKLARADH